MSSVSGSSPGALSQRASARVSQRASRSCTECKRRKIRCDKTVPCSQCLRAKAPDRCRVETVELTTKYTKSRQEIEFLHQLQESLTSSPLAEAQGLITRRLTLLETGHEPTKPQPPTVPRGTSEHFHDVLNDQKQDETVDTAIALLRLGRGYPDPKDTLDQGGLDRDYYLSISEYLPDESTARKLVKYYLEHLSWHHAVLHHPTFMFECESFWASGDTLTPQWLCLYFAVLSAAAYNLPERLCDVIYTKKTLLTRSDFWYHQMVATLGYTDYTANHSPFSLQAIIISCMVAHPLGQSVRQMVLLSSALRIAQCLGFAAQSPTRATNEDGTINMAVKIDEEVSRRLWWQILIQDYFWVPMAGSYGVSPKHFTTPMPLNCHDEDLIDLPPYVPTINSYCINLAKMALLMPQLIDGLRSPANSTRDAQYRHIKLMHNKMRLLMDELPPFLRPETPFDPSWPSWVSWARSTLTISAADKIIMIHRSFLIKSLQDSVTYDFTRRTCVSAALTILNEFHRIKNNDVVQLWIIPTFTVSAAIVIGLDIFYRMKNGEAHEPKHLDLLNNTIDALKLMHYDRTVSQGIGLLEKMMTTPTAAVSPSAWDESTGTMGTGITELLGYLGQDVPWEPEIKFEPPTM